MMKRKIAAMVVLLALLIAPVSAQTDTERVSLPIGDKIAVDLGDSILYLDRVAYTPSPSTETPVPSTPTSTPVSTGAEPNISAPYCTDLGLVHDPHAWHPHWNAEAGCFWDEFHGDDPNSPEMVAIFGAIEQPVFGGPQSSSEVEHTVKHRGDVVFAAAEGDPNWLAEGRNSNADGFPDVSINDSVKAYRVVLHADDLFNDFLFSIHGYKAEFYVCTQESGYQDCGTMSVKGHMIFDTFRTPFYTSRDLRPGCDADTQDCDFGFGYEFSYDADQPKSSPNDEPYVQVQRYVGQTINGIPVLDWLRGRTTTNSIQWSMSEIGPCNSLIDFDDGTCKNNYLRFLFITFDAGVIAGGPSGQALNDYVNICFGQPNCVYDNSRKGIGEVQAWVEPEWDMLDGVSDNHITGVLWVDRFQQPKDNQSSCTVEGLGATTEGDCFKMEFEHYPISPGAATNRRLSGSRTDATYLTEYNECQPDFDCKVR